MTVLIKFRNFTVQYVMGRLGLVNWMEYVRTNAMNFSKRAQAHFSQKNFLRNFSMNTSQHAHRRV